MFIIPPSETIKLKNDLLISIEYETDTGVKLEKNTKWLYHSINVYAEVNHEKKMIAYLTLAYFDEERKKEYADDLLLFIQKYKRDSQYIPNNRFTTLKDITEEEIHIIFNNLNYSEMLTPEMTKLKKINKLKSVMAYTYQESYDDFLTYFYNKPEPDFIHVDKEYRRMGIGGLLYQKAIELCALNNLNFYQSTTQTQEAKYSWESLKKKIDNINYEDHFYKTKEGVVSTKRYFVDNQSNKPMHKVKKKLK